MATNEFNLLDKIKYKIRFTERDRKGSEIEAELLMDEIEVLGLSESLDDNGFINEDEYGAYEVLERQFIEAEDVGAMFGARK